MLLSDLLSIDLLRQHVDNGYVSERTHPDSADWKIYNYTPKCQYERAWDSVTLKTRGLIVQGDCLLARGPEKFFNYGESDAPDIDPNKPFTAYDKMDGSLGIMYRAPDGKMAIATRGSFVSEQAIKGTEMLRSLSPEQQSEITGPSSTSFGYICTSCFEIIYPENRIVVDYGDVSELVMLGYQFTRKMPYVGGYSKFIPCGSESKFENGTRTPQSWEFNSLKEMLEANIRSGKEGFVAHQGEGSDRVIFKVKQQDYVELHRIVTGLNARTVWEAWTRGDSLEKFAEPLPDEFFNYVEKTWDGLVEESEFLKRVIEYEYDTYKGISERKEFALAVANSEHKPFHFLLRDGKDIMPKIRDMVRPVGNSGPRDDE